MGFRERGIRIAPPFTTGNVPVPKGNGRRVAQAAWVHLKITREQLNEQYPLLTRDVAALLGTRPRMVEQWRRTGLQNTRGVKTFLPALSIPGVASKDGRIVYRYSTAAIVTWAAEHEIGLHPDTPRLTMLVQRAKVEVTLTKPYKPESDPEWADFGTIWLPTEESE